MSRGVEGEGERERGEAREDTRDETRTGTLDGDNDIETMEVVRRTNT